MSTPAEAATRVTAAATACDNALAEWAAAARALKSDVSVNGCGVIHDRSEFRQRLAVAKQHLEAGLAALEGVDWPSDDDYDAL